MVSLSLLISLSTNDSLLSSQIDIGQNVEWKITSTQAQSHLMPYTTFSTNVLSLKDMTSSNYIPEALRMEVVPYFSVRMAINGRDYVIHPPLARALHNLDH